MPTETTQLEMFQEDLLNAILGQTLSPEGPDEENAPDTVEEPEPEK